MIFPIYRKAVTALRPGFHVNYVYRLIPKQIELFKANGLFPEFYLGAHDMDTFSVAQFRETALQFRDADLDISIHAPIYDLRPGSVDSKISGASVDRLLQAVEVGCLFSPKTMVCHSGYSGKMTPGVEERWLDVSTAAWDRISARAEDRGVVLALENSYEPEPVLLLTLLERVDSPNFRACFDVGHFNTYARYPLADWVAEITPYLVELHLHDNHRDGDRHLIAGQGSFDFKALFSLLGQTDIVPVLCLEVNRLKNAVGAAEAMTRILEECDENNAFVTRILGK